MFPCVGQIVVPKADEPTRDGLGVCRICGKTLRGSDQSLARKAKLCVSCYVRSVKSVPNLVQ
ncbi:MAG: hypothetical protein JRH07_14115 [Deltaproteobacteria bacterium]|nr:hypothetical protein [Deltaproteobacteria bacterium]MBW2122958.1 hypothetical protein [Deltaproteobacteria bacterium]